MQATDERPRMPAAYLATRTDLQPIQIFDDRIARIRLSFRRLL
jgi:hypothetical protein